MSYRDAQKIKDGPFRTHTFSPDTSVSDIARRNGVSRGLLNVWRREARAAMAERSLFARVEIEDASAGGSPPRELGMAPSEPDARTERIEVAIAGATVLVPAGADARTLTNVFAALRSAR